MCKQMSSGLFKMLSTNYSFTNHIYLYHVYLIYICIFDIKQPRWFDMPQNTTKQPKDN